MFSPDVLAAIAGHLEPRELAMFTHTCKAYSGSEAAKRACMEATFKRYSRSEYVEVRYDDTTVIAQSRYGFHQMRVRLVETLKVAYHGSVYTFHGQIDKPFVGDPTLTPSNLNSRVVVRLWFRDVDIRGDSLSFTLVAELAGGPVTLSLRSC